MRPNILRIFFLNFFFVNREREEKERLAREEKEREEEEYARHKAKMDEMEAKVIFLFVYNLLCVIFTILR